MIVILKVFSGSVSDTYEGGIVNRWGSDHA
jgi:hypothetical protein